MCRVPAVLLAALSLIAEASSSSGPRYKVRAGAAYLQVTQAGSERVLFDVRPLANEGFELYRKSMAGDNVGRCVYTRSFQPVALVGHFFTFRDTLEASCEREAHPSAESRWTTVDLNARSLTSYGAQEDSPLTIPQAPPETANASRIMALTNWFDSGALLDALRNDSVIKDGVASVSSLAAIPEALGEGGLPVPYQPCHFTLASDFLTRFRFMSFNASEVAVGLQMTPAGGACRAASAELGLLIPKQTFLKGSSLSGPLISFPSSAPVTTVEFHLPEKH